MWVAYLSGGVVAGIAVYFLARHYISKALKARDEANSRAAYMEAQALKESMEKDLKKAQEEAKKKEYEINDW